MEVWLPPLISWRRTPGWWTASRRRAVVTHHHSWLCRLTELLHKRRLTLPLDVGLLHYGFLCWRWCQYSHVVTFMFPDPEIAVTFEVPDLHAYWHVFHHSIPFRVVRHDHRSLRTNGSLVPDGFHRTFYVMLWLIAEDGKFYPLSHDIVLASGRSPVGLVNPLTETMLWTLSCARTGMTLSADNIQRGPHVAEPHPISAGGNWK